MKEIQLTRGYVALIDDEDYEYLSQFKWHTHGKPGYSQYASRKIGTSHLLMHRELINPLKHEQVDHKNGNGLDNRRNNLRICTNQQNHMNERTRRVEKTSKFKGVHHRGFYNRWQARIVLNGKRISLGHFEKEIEAAKAYNEAAKKHYGEFARLNQI